MKKFYAIAFHQTKAIAIACTSGAAALMLMFFIILLIGDPSTLANDVFTPLREQLREEPLGPEGWMMIPIAVALVLFALGIAFYLVPVALAALLGWRLASQNPLFYGMAAMTIDIMWLVAQIVTGSVEPVEGISLNRLAVNVLPPFLAGVVYWYFGVRERATSLQPV